jgi:putative phosphoesterase
VRIGLIADTHIPESVRKLWPQVHEVFRGIDCILHAGDLHSGALIDELAALAPVFVARGNGDVEVVHERLRDSWVLEFDDVTVCLIHEFPRPNPSAKELIQSYIERKFPGIAPDVVVYGHSHRDEISFVDDIIYINPGSPTFPRHKSARLGTIGFLDVENGTPKVSLYQLTDTGILLLEERDPGNFHTGSVECR